MTRTSKDPSANGRRGPAGSLKVQSLAVAADSNLEVQQGATEFCKLLPVIMHRGPLECALLGRDVMQGLQLYVNMKEEFTFLETTDDEETALMRF